jgi:hypothetical protein
MNKPVEPKRVPILGNANAEINNHNDRTGERIGKFLEPPDEGVGPPRAKGSPRKRKGGDLAITSSRGIKSKTKTAGKSRKPKP